MKLWRNCCSWDSRSSNMINRRLWLFRSIRLYSIWKGTKTSSTTEIGTAGSGRRSQLCSLLSNSINCSLLKEKGILIRYQAKSSRSTQGSLFGIPSWSLESVSLALCKISSSMPYTWITNSILKTFQPFVLINLKICSSSGSCHSNSSDPNWDNRALNCNQR